MAVEQCYNKGCCVKFNPEENTDTSCQYHPGQPVFHDALKGWSCCSKRSSDFTEFLNFKGCTTGCHSNVKPPEPDKPVKDSTDSEEVIVVEAPRQRLPRPSNPANRPPADAPRQKLKVIVAPSLQTQLEKLKLEDQSETDSKDSESKEIAAGTKCTNNACTCAYMGPESNSESCQHHPGYPVFHEGMKFWTCCTRRTSDFDSFLKQEGCTTGTHVWVKSKEQKTAEAQCRVDWHQTGSIVCVSIFAKMADPDLTFIEANQVTLNVKVIFGKGSSIFQKTFHLRDVIIPEQSTVKMLGTKVEINLKKGESFSWRDLELAPQAKDCDQ